jgi:DNA-binding transcriptional MerR regulator
VVAPKPQKLFKIGEVMEYTGLSRQTLHNYTMLGLIKAAKRTEAGHRLYDESVFEVIDRIKELRGSHTLEEVRTILNQEAPTRHKA